ncbi:MAG: YeaH/YhbH family protein, partial [Mesorhizobium sp.]
LYFEDLELPDMVKLNLKEILAFKPRRAGFAATGSPTNINVGRTMRNSHGRRIALRRPKQGELDAILEEIAMLELVQSSAATRQRIAALRE